MLFLNNKKIINATIKNNKLTLDHVKNDYDLKRSSDIYNLCNKIEDLGYNCIGYTSIDDVDNKVERIDSEIDIFNRDLVIDTDMIRKGIDECKNNKKIFDLLDEYLTEPFSSGKGLYGFSTIDEFESFIDNLMNILDDVDAFRKAVDIINNSLTEKNYSYKSDKVNIYNGIKIASKIILGELKDGRNRSIYDIVKKDIKNYVWNKTKKHKKNKHRKWW